MNNINNHDPIFHLNDFISETPKECLNGLNKFISEKIFNKFFANCLPSQENYRKVEQILHPLDQDQIDLLSEVCEKLLKHPKMLELPKLRQKVKIFFIATKILKKRRLPPIKSFITPLMNQLNELLSLSEINNIFKVAEKICRQIVRKASIENLFLNFCSKWFLSVKDKDKIFDEKSDKMRKSCSLVRKIYFGFDEIGSLKELRHFPNLEELNFYHCALFFDTKTDCMKEFPKIKNLNILNSRVNFEYHFPHLENLIIAAPDTDKLSPGVNSCSLLKKAEFSWPNELDLNLFSQSEELKIRYTALKSNKKIRCNKLRKLDLFRSEIDFNQLEAPNLEELNLLECNEYKIKNIKKLENFSNLKELKFNFYSFSLELAECLKKLPNLKKFSFTKGDLNKNLNGFEHFVLLEELNLAYCEDLSDEELLTLSKNCSNLIKLNLRGTKISSLKFLEGCFTLEELNLADCEHLSQEYLLAFIKYCLNLRKLNLQGTKISSLNFLEGCFKLEELNLANCTHLSQEDLLILRENCPNLKILNLQGTKISNVNFLEGCFKLEELNLAYCEDLSEEQLLTLSKNCPNLRKLNFQRTKISNVNFLEGYFKLEELNLAHCKHLSLEEDLILSEYCPNLKRLNLSETKISILKFLEGCFKLEELNLAYCEDLSKEEILTLSKNCLNLSYLDLKKSKIDQLEDLKKLSQLKFLNLEGTSISLICIANFNKSYQDHVLKISSDYDVKHGYLFCDASYF